MNAPGEVVLGRCRVLGPLGAGGMGVVLAGEHLDRGLPVAIKVLSAEGPGNPAVVRAFANEARAVAALSHPGVVRILDHGEVDEEAARRAGGLLVAGSPYLTMPRAAGGSLRDFMGRLDWPALRSLLLGLLDALAHAHARGVLHRDLKPGNVLLVDPSGPGGGTWLADFGLVHLVQARHPGAARLYGGGTPPYTAPEQRRGDLVAQGPWTDLYALGMLARAMASPARGLRWPSGLEGWIARLTDPDPRARPAFAARAAEALMRLDPGAPTLSAGWIEEQPPSRLTPMMSPAVLALRAPPLVGRRAERDALWSTLRQACRSGGVRALRLEGPAGAGRSRLAGWLAEQAHQRGLADVVRVACLDQPGAEDPLAGALAVTLGLEGADAARARERLDQVFTGPGWSEAARGQLAELLVPARARGLSVRVHDPPLRRALLRRALLSLSTQGPLLLILDDLHLDLEMIELLRALLGPAGRSGGALFVLASLCPDELAWRPAERAALEALPEALPGITLAPLPDAEHAELVRGIVGAPRALLAELIDQTRGDPRFAVQLVRHWVDTGRLRAGPEGWERVGEPELPDALQDLYAHRLLRALAPWPPAARRGVFVAAVHGQALTHEGWASLCAEAEALADPALPLALARAGLARVGAEGWGFSSSLVRACAARLAEDEGLAPALHLACARALPEAEDEGRALHLLAAGADALAVEPLLRALRSAQRGQRLHQVDRLLGLADGVLARPGLPPSSPAALQVRLVRASQEISRMRLEEAEAMALGVLADTRAAGEGHLEAQAHRLLGLIAWHRGQVDAFLERVDQVERLGDPSHRRLAMLDRAHGLRLKGRMAEAAAWGERALARTRADGDDRGALLALRFQVMVRVSDPLDTDVLSLAGELRALAESHGAMEEVASGCFSQSEVLRRLGRLDEALDASRAGAEALSMAGSELGALLGHINVGVVRADQGRLVEARQELEAALGLLAARGVAVHTGYVVCWLLRALVLLGDHDAVDPAWAGVDMSLARIHGFEMGACAAEAARRAEQARRPEVARLAWTLARRAAEGAGVAEARAFAEAALRRLDAPGAATLPPEPG